MVLDMVGSEAAAFRTRAACYMGSLAYQEALALSLGISRDKLQRLLQLIEEEGITPPLEATRPKLPRPKPITPKPKPLPELVESIPEATVDEMVTQIMSGAERRVLIKDIASAVAKKHGISLIQLRGHSRAHYICMARFEAWWLCREFLACSLPQLGYFFGRRDHTTILHGIRRHQQLLDLERDKIMKAQPA